MSYIPILLDFLTFANILSRHGNLDPRQVFNDEESGNL